MKHDNVFKWILHRIKQSNSEKQFQEMEEKVLEIYTIVLEILYILISLYSSSCWDSLNKMVDYIHTCWRKTVKGEVLNFGSTTELAT